ncbi:hypothetical protein PsYK624_126460 [Phanerochaete sordida]|uniref:Uncharacterized protein n=1 Tax=Phanerochaete sordida TaxID=48140 RepID=A0A9P3GLI6_9APHY|nr:hypothetical protein PsYK624_126460 [Phanerochaete sordida]
MPSRTASNTVCASFASLTCRRGCVGRCVSCAAGRNVRAAVPRGEAVRACRRRGCPGLGGVVDGYIRRRSRAPTVPFCTVSASPKPFPTWVEGHRT